MGFPLSKVWAMWTRGEVEWNSSILSFWILLRFQGVLSLLSPFPLEFQVIGKGTPDTPLLDSDGRALMPMPMAFLILHGLIFSARNGCRVETPSHSAFLTAGFTATPSSLKMIYFFSGGMAIGMSVHFCKCGRWHKCEREESIHCVQRAIRDLGSTLLSQATSATRTV